METVVLNGPDQRLEGQRVGRSISCPEKLLEERRHRDEKNGCGSWMASNTGRVSGFCQIIAETLALDSYDSCPIRAVSNGVRWLNPPHTHPQTPQTRSLLPGTSPDRVLVLRP